MKKILLIEDDRDLNTGLTCDLELENYRVCSAFTLGEGMEILTREEVDLILLDGNLPDGDGFDFCRAVKAEQDIPVIFLTARDMERDEMKGFDCGADDYITKPFKMPILHRRIQAALRKSGKTADRAVYDDGYLKIGLLLEKIWDQGGSFVDEHTVAVNINRLRKKIETPVRSYIKTLYGMGYQWKGGK